VTRYAHFSVEDLKPALDAISAMENRGGERTVYEKVDFSQAGADVGLFSP
jgi:hypothetical protein